MLERNLAYEERTYQSNRDDKETVNRFNTVSYLREKSHSKEPIVSVRDHYGREFERVRFPGVSVPGAIASFTPAVGPKAVTGHAIRCCKGAILLGEEDCGNCSICGRFLCFGVSKMLH